MTFRSSAFLHPSLQHRCTVPSETLKLPMKRLYWNHKESCLCHFFDTVAVKVRLPPPQPHKTIHSINESRKEERKCGNHYSDGDDRLSSCLFCSISFYRPLNTNLLQMQLTCCGFYQSCKLKRRKENRRGDTASIQQQDAMFVCVFATLAHGELEQRWRCRAIFTTLLICKLRYLQSEFGENQRV